MKKKINLNPYNIVIDEIIDIYNGKYSSYVEYYRETEKKYNCDVFNVMSDDLYHYIIDRKKGEEKQQELTSKEALENWYNTESPATKAYEYELHYRIIKKDLERLENIKSKTHLLYNQRAAIAREYIDWCEKNKAVLTDPTNMATWFLCDELRKWLE